MTAFAKSSLLVASSLMLCLPLLGCGGDKKPEYGVEQKLRLPGRFRQVWAVAPVINDSGQKSVDPILQWDLIYKKLQSVEGLTVIPVNKLVDVLNSLGIERVQSAEQAALICDVLGADALLIPTVTIYDPYDPPKMAASLNLFRRGGYRRPMNVDIRELARRAAPATMPSPRPAPGFVQVVRVFDSADGSTRAAVLQYAQGRIDPTEPYQQRIYLVEMDRYAGFVYHALITELLARPQLAELANDRGQ